MGRVDGKVAIVTGSGSGIGRATAKLLAREGASVVLADIAADAVEAAAKEIRAGGDKAVAVVTDVSDEAAVEAMVRTAVDEFGGLDVLHNNAAITDRDHLAFDGQVGEMSAELWDRTMAVNLRGPMLGCKHALPHLLRRGGGSIVNTSSGAGIRGDLALAAYTTSKGALNALTLAVATQYGKRGIRCNAVLPGSVQTEASAHNRPQEFVDMMLHSTAAPRLGIPDDIAHMVLFLASDDSKFVSGQLISVDGGLTCHLPQYAEMITLIPGQPA